MRLPHLIDVEGEAYHGRASPPVHTGIAALSDLDHVALDLTLRVIVIQ